MALISTTLTSLLATSRAPHPLQYAHLSRPWLTLATTLAQISTALFLLRALTPLYPWDVFLGALVLPLALVNLASAVASGLVCRPLERLWDGGVGGECLPEGAELGIAYLQGGESRSAGSGLDRVLTGEPGVAVFTFFSLAAVPVVAVKDLLKGARWPFYILSGSMLL